MKRLNKMGILLFLMMMIASLNSCFFESKNERAGHYKIFDQYENQNIYGFLDWDDSDATRRYVLFNNENFNYQLTDEMSIDEDKIQSKSVESYYSGDFLYDTGVFDSYDSLFPEFVKNNVLSIYEKYGYYQNSESRYFESHILYKENQYFGYLNIYKRTGRLTRGHGLHVEDLYQSIYFTIEDENHYTIHQVFKDGAIVAFHQNFVICYEKQKYYSYNIDNDEKVFMMDDIALNHGISSQSYTMIYFNGDKVFFEMSYSPTFGFPKTQIWITSFDGKNKFNVFDNFN